MKKALLLLILVYLLLVGCSDRGPEGETAVSIPISLTDEAGQYPLAGRVAVLKDPTGQLTIEQVASQEMDGRFAPSETPTPQFGISRDAFWLRFSLDDRSQNIREWLLDIPYALLEHIDLFVPQPDGSYQKQQAGLLIANTEQSVPESYYTFELPAGLQPGQPVYLRVTSSGSLVIPMTVWSQNLFARHERTDNLVWGIYFGIMLGMAIYNI